MKKTLTNIYEKIVWILFFVIVTFLFVLSFTSTCHLSFDYNEYTFFLSDSLLKNTIIIFVFLTVVFFVKKLSIIKKINENNKLFTKLKYIFLILLGLISLIWVLGSKLQPAADQYSVQKSVQEFINGDYSAFVKNGYISQNRQQRGLFLLSYLFSFIFGNNYLAMQIVNVLACVFIYKNLSEISKEFGANNFIQLLIIISAFFYPIIPLYTYFIYGNILGLSFSLIAFKYELLYFKDTKIKNCIISALAIGFALMAKSTYLVYFIAMLIYAIIRMVNDFDKKKLIYFLFIVVFYLLSSFIPTAFIESKTGVKMAEGTSYWSYVAMGLQEGERAPGWYNGYNNDSYVECNNDTEKQTKKAKDYIENRLSEMLGNKTYALSFFIEKIASEWNNPTCQVFWNIQDKFPESVKQDSIFRKFVSMQSVVNMQKYLNISHLLIMFGTLLYAFFNLFKKDNYLKTIIPMTFIGGFILLSFLSEAKAQYSIMFTALLFPCSIVGYFEFAKLQLTDKTVLKEVWNIKYILCIVFVIIMIVCTSNYSYLIKDNSLYYKYISENGNFDYLNPPEYY